MKMAYNQTNNIMIENARLIFKNFSGEESKFNRGGNKNFSVLLDQDKAKDLLTGNTETLVMAPDQCTQIPLEGHGAKILKIKL